MKSFLEDVAASVVAKYGVDLSKLGVVLPTNRAAIYFKAALSALNITPPKTTTIDSFINSLVTKRSKAHNFTLVALLYDIYKKYLPNQTFDDFYSFGKLLLSDFDSIDKYLVDAKALYSIVSDTKQLDYAVGVDDEAKILATKFWSTVNHKEEKLNKEHEFVNIWKSLFPIYQEFNQLLNDKGLAYGGKLYREAAIRISEEEDLDSINSNHIIFVGLNALSRSEKVILQRFNECGKADFIWDYDQEWQRFNSIEANYFIDKNLALLPQADYFVRSERNSYSETNIRVIPSTIDAAQVKIATSLIEKDLTSNGGGNLEKTAIILPDESLVTPLLYSLSPLIGKLNISMGYPLSATPVLPLLDSLILLRKRAKIALETDEINELSFYHKDIESLFKHVYISQLCSKVPELDPNCSNKIYYTTSELIEIAPEVAFLFLEQTIKSPLAKYLTLAFHNLLESTVDISDEQQLYISKIHELLNQVHALVSSTPSIKISDSLYIKLLKGELSKQSLEFEGYSGSGLQIIGILESRALDFDNIIMLSLSDDIFPASKPDNSYIPQLLLQVYGMPTIAEKSAIWSYYFYRLLQRSNKVSLLYCNNTSGLSSGEPSRYIMQLNYSLPYEIEHQEIKYEEISSSLTQKINVKKTTEMVNKLKAGRYFPSQINQFLKCPLGYYLKYIAKLKEPQHLIDENIAATSGNLIHNTLEELYKPLIGKIKLNNLLQEISKKDIETTLKEFIDRDVSPTLKQDSSSLDILYQSALRMVEGIIKYDINSKELESIISLEELLESKIGGYKICGKIDRLERLTDNSIKVIDYKSGKVELEFATLEELFEIDYQGKKKRDGALQLLLYSYLARQTYEYDIDIRAALLSTRHLGSLNQQKYKGEVVIGKQSLDILELDTYKIIEEKIIEVLDNLCNIEIDFCQTSNNNNCTYCSYSSICGR